jgi:LysR family hydrogen peroxide-inducible transcriptional activator
MVALPVSEPGLTEHPLFDESFLLVRPVAQAAEPVPRLEELARMPLLLLEEGHCFRDQAIAACKLPRTPRGEIMEGSSLSTLVQMVAAGLGVTLIPEMAAAVESRSAPVVVQRLASPPSRTVGLVWRQSDPLADRYVGLADALRSFRA